MTPDQVRQILREELQSLLASDRYTFQKHIQMFDGRNFQLGKTTGTKIGTAATQKLGFYGATPVVQAAAISAPNNPGGTYSGGDAATAVTAINSIRTALKNAGISA